MSLVELSALVGTLMPMLVAVINQPKWPSWLRAVATAGLCIVAGGITAAASDGLTGKTWLQGAGIVFAAALAAYHAWWKPSGIAPAIEKATALK
jgi:hypothetical protein